MRLPLTLAMTGYDHVLDLETGAVDVEGVDLTVLRLPVEEIFFRFLRYREWHVSELSMAKYTALRAAGDTSLVAIPVFPSRVCRHSSIYVRPDGPSSPKELAGGRIGVPEWAQTASVYTRALLQHEWGIALEDIRWFQAGVNTPGRAEKVALHLPEGISLTPVPDRCLEDMLRAGDLDAVLSAHPPDGFGRGEGGIVRLFPDYRPVEQEYVARTGILPIMHITVIRSDVHESAPWVAANLLTAFEEAKRRSLQRLSEMTVSRVPLPWVPEMVADMRRLLGPDPWPYGVEPNRPTLEAFTRWAHEQGVAARRLEPEELFVPQVLDRYKV
ncbi:MAG: 4,5-dihydroxyphthalate decarboxylase [Acidimicrobiales bacterium]